MNAMRRSVQKSNPANAAVFPTKVPRQTNGRLIYAWSYIRVPSNRRSLRTAGRSKSDAAGHPDTNSPVWSNIDSVLESGERTVLLSSQTSCINSRVASQRRHRPSGGAILVSWRYYYIYFIY